MAKNTGKKKRIVPPPSFRSKTEEEILRVLWNHEGRGLVRSQVHRQLALPPKERPTAARVGQILQNFFKHGYLQRDLASYQGRTKTSYYRLSDKGRSACRQHYQFDHNTQVLFQVNDGDFENYLRAENFDGDPDAPTRRVVGFYTYAGGLGQTSLIAHLGGALATEEPSKHFLLVDFNSESPDLDRFFPKLGDGQDSDRGLRGLAADFYQQPDWQKEAWLQENLDRYLIRPKPEQAPNLYLLRSGLESAQNPVQAAERTTALSFLHSELSAGVSREGLPKSAHLLPRLHKVLVEQFHLTLVDSEGRRSLSALALTQLADQLIVGTRPTEISTTTEGLRLITASFLKAHSRSKRLSHGVSIIFHMSEFGDSRIDGRAWIDSELLESEGDLPKREPWFLPQDLRFRDERNWNEYPKAFAPFARRLLGFQEKDTHVPLGYKALQTMLDPETMADYRIMMAAWLESMNFDELSAHLKSYLKDTSRPKTDQKGRQALEKVLAVHRDRILESLQVETTTEPDNDPTLEA